MSRGWAPGGGGGELLASRLQARGYDERGRTLFEDEDIACATCHSGSRMTNNETVDVGTGGAFQVPSLVGVSARAPYLHDGRAATLRDGLGSSGRGDHHGVTSG